MYNSPSEDLEFIEFYNNSTDTINLAGYQIVAGVSFNFPNERLAPGELFVVTNDSLVYDRFYIPWVIAYQYQGSLNNDGELIAVTDNQQDTIIKLAYDDRAPWPHLADGLGPSIVLCDPNSPMDDPHSWDIFHDFSFYGLLTGEDVNADPGRTNTCLDDYEFWVSDQDRHLFSEAAGIVEIPIYLAKTYNEDQTVIIWNLGTATAGEDYRVIQDTLTFLAGQTSPEYFIVELIDDSLSESYEAISIHLNSMEGDTIINFLTSIGILDNDGSLESKVELRGVMQTPEVKAIELYIQEDIFVSDLLYYGIGSANNGNGSDSTEFNIWAGHNLLVETAPRLFFQEEGCAFITNDTIRFKQFFGPIDNNKLILQQDLGMSFNGNDAIELFEKGQVIDVFGNIGEDGEGAAWEYTDSWAKKRVLGQSTVFNESDWNYGSIGALDVITNDASSDPYPLECGPTATEDLIHNEVLLYPNPTNGLISIQSDQPIKRIIVYDLRGRVVLTPQNHHQIDLSELVSGVYITQLEIGDEVIVERVIVESSVDN